MKKLVFTITLLATLAYAGSCYNVTVTDENGIVHTVLVCD
jgi:hypothetical protein